MNAGNVPAPVAPGNVPAPIAPGNVPAPIAPGNVPAPNVGNVGVAVFKFINNYPYCHFSTTFT
jgi:hypothetical protein